MKKIQVLLAMICCHHALSAQVVDLTSGGAGTTTAVPQSFNETRGVDITVLANPLLLNTATLHRFCTGGVNDSGYVSIRIYDPSNQSLLFNHDTVVHPLYDDSVAIPVYFMLNAGQHYRLSFSCYGYGNNHNSGSGFMYQPTFPYNDAGNKVQVNSAHGGNVNTYPASPNIFVPFITLRYDAAPSLVETYFSQHDFQFSPNPFSTQTQLHADIDLQHARLIVYDLFGQKVYELSDLNGRNPWIDVKGLPSGLYTVHLIQQQKILYRTTWSLHN